MSTDSDISLTKEELENYDYKNPQGIRHESSEEVRDIRNKIQTQIEYLNNRHKVIKDILSSPNIVTGEDYIEKPFYDEEQILNNRNLLNDIIKEKYMYI
jgi:hypothetical protein